MNRFSTTAIGLACLVASPAFAGAFDNDGADFAQSSGPIEHHQIWTFKCRANRDGSPYLVGADYRDGTLQVMASPGSKPITYYGHIDQLSPSVFEARASRPPPYGWITLHAEGSASWLRTAYGRDECQTVRGFDPVPTNED